MIADTTTIADLEAKISSVKLTLAQLAAQDRYALRLRQELGQSLYEVHSAALKRPREKQSQLERELAQTGEVYAKMRKDAFSQLNDYPELLRKLQQENDIAIIQIS
jgi:hypothetical protein